MEALTQQELIEEINSKAQQLRALINELFDDHLEEMAESSAYPFINLTNAICDYLNID